MKNTQIATVNEKPFNMYLAVGRVLIAGVAVMTMLFTVKAVFSDNVLDTLEQTYSQSMGLHSKLQEAAKLAKENEEKNANIVCLNYRALKFYKESKGMPIKNDYNPCVSLKQDF